MPRRTRVALALGSGGARGYAHIGAIQVLEERGYEIVSIAGTSMGAVVGGLHAAGQLEPYTAWVSDLSQRSVLRLLDPSFKAPGVIRAEKILAKVTELLHGAVIEDLAIPFTAVATDLLARKEVWFQRGPVDAAIRASIALPSVITPVMMHGRLLVDGGLLNPIPIAATSASSADMTVAVALSEEHLTTGGAAPVQETAEPDADEDWLDGARRSAAGVFDSDLVRTIASWFGSGREEDASDATELPVEATGTPSAESARGEEPDAAGDLEEPEDLFGSLPPGLRTLDIMQLSMDALQSVVTRYRLAGYPPDLLVTVPKSSCRTLDFHRAREMIEIGRQATIDALDRDASLH